MNTKEYIKLKEEEIKVDNLQDFSNIEPKILGRIETILEKENIFKNSDEFKQYREENKKEISILVGVLTSKALNIKFDLTKCFFTRTQKQNLLDEIKSIDSNKGLTILVNEGQLWNFYSLQQSNSENIDFRFIANKYKIKWNLLYVENLWESLNGSRNIRISEQPIPFTKEDLIALIIASRYLGKVNNVFNLKNNFDNNFFKPLTMAFFHAESFPIDESLFFSQFKISNKIWAEEARKVLFKEKNIMKYNPDELLEISDNLSALKPLNFDLFLKAVVGRNLIEKNHDLFSSKERKKYRNLFSSLDHSTDFVIVALITKDRDNFEKAFKEVMDKIRSD